MTYRLSMILLMGCLTLFFARSVQAEPDLKHKIGQMILVGFSGKRLSEEAPIIKAIQAGEVGGVILFDYNFQTKTFDRNIESPDQLRQLTTFLQKHASPPLLIGIDYEGGKVNRLKPDYGFPEAQSAEALVKAGTAVAEKQAAEMAATMAAAGINLDFAPVLDVNLNPDNPVIGKLGRSFSKDPAVVTHFGRIFSRAFHHASILCAYKHFPGHGSSTLDSHLGFVDVTQTWQPLELEPYRQLLDSHDRCQLVMMAHITHQGLDPEGYPATLSYRITTGLLRNALHFKGVIITDDLQMKAITTHYGVPEAVRLAIQAGADILVFGNQLVAEPQDPAEIVNLIYHDVLTGKIPRARIEASWRRIMRLKRALGAT